MQVSILHEGFCPHSVRWNPETTKGITDERKVPVSLCYLIDVDREEGHVTQDYELMKEYNFTALLVIQTKDDLQDGKYEPLSSALLHEEDYETCQEIIYQMADEGLNQYTTFDKDVQTHLLYDVTRISSRLVCSTISESVLLYSAFGHSL